MGEADLARVWNGVTAQWLPFAQKDDYESCLRILTRFWRSLKSGGERDWYRSRVLGMKGHFHEELGDAPAAIRQYKEAAKHETRGWVNALNYSRLATLLEADDPLRSLGYVSQALNCTQPGDSIVVRLLGMLLARESITGFERALAQHRKLILSIYRSRGGRSSENVVAAYAKAKRMSAK